MKLISALDSAGIELIGERAISEGGGRGVRLRWSTTNAEPIRDGETETPPRVA
jgi:hypothetical protein